MNVELIRGSETSQKEAETILQAMGDGGILNISKEERGTFLLTEGCDNYFSIRLSPQQLFELGQELMLLSKITI